MLLFSWIYILLSCFSPQDNWIIHSTGVGPIELGISFEDAKGLIGNLYQISPNEKGGFDLYEDSKKIISIWSKDQDSTIGFIKIYSEKFNCHDGIRVGSTIEEVEKTRMDFFLEMDDISGEAFFAPSEFQKKDGERIESLNLFYFKSPDEDALAEFEYNPEKQAYIASSYNPKGMLNYFLIYKWK